LLLLSTHSAFAAEARYLLRSPDGKTEVQLRIGDKVLYTVLHKGAVVVGPSPIGLVTREAGAVKPVVTRKEERAVDQKVHPAVREKRREIADRFHELRLTFQGGFGLTWRAYDNGVAWRWTSALPGELTILGEEASFGFTPNATVYYPREDDFYSHNERRYVRYLVKDIPEVSLASCPALVATEGGLKVWISEADLYDYAGMWLRGTSSSALAATFPAYPAEEKQTSDRDLRVTRRGDFIAKTKGTRAFPWRVLATAERDADLVDNQLVFLLSESTSEDFSWVRPGKVPWDWWNAWNLVGVDFPTGVNTATYKFYVDFAAKYGLEYLILDEGWSKTDDLLSVNPHLDLPELIAYAKQRNVGVIPWVVWLTLDKQFDAAFDQFERLGVQGLKVDFMQRDDQKMVGFYERVAKEAARRHLLVDFHGAYKPTGMQRQYPNLISREGVFGLEQNKWSDAVTPEHNVTLPFIRMVAGPMDYTPGAMTNANARDFRAIFERPMSQGTRCHQLAMYVVYESPLQMLADSPTAYLREPEVMDLLSAVPTVWDETVALDGRVGEYVVVARKSALGEWYVGAMTNWTARDLTFDLSFLDPGKHQAQIWQDGVNAARVGNDYKKVERSVTWTDRLQVHLAPGGGWVARIK
jgi:alpha-glucosidase